MEKAYKDIVSAIALPIEFKNPVSSIEMLLSIELPLEAKKRIAAKLIKTILSIDLTETEKEEIKSIIYHTKGIFRDKKEVISRLDSKVPVQKNDIDGSYKANSLFVVDENSVPFGVVHPITATSINDGKGEHKVVANELSRMVSLSIYTVHEAIRFTLGKYGLGPHGYKNLDNYGITVQVGKIGNIYEGSSIGLAASCAIMASMLDVPISPYIAFTGSINIRGTIEEVEGIDVKLRIARLKGIKDVYIPEKNMKEIEEDHKINIIPVSELSDVLNMVFSRKRITSFVYKLNKTGSMATATIDSSLLKSKGQKRALISTVGMRDPYGASYQDQENSLFSEGPILTAYRRLSPETILLLPTRQTMKNAIKTKEEIERISGNNICHIKTIEITDPTDYDSIYIAILAALNSASDLLKDKEKYCSISSGTPQIQAVFIELLRSGRLYACPIQVLEPRFATSWEDRVKPIKSEYLGFGL
ncbi:MAG TPA: hypothetical protein PLJ17_11025 [Syntrophorhabdaceae bacterium]|nr:hypothetical protein [Syntrophorhabdaceae bacterium]HQH44295.1 hypothetical protein [Syntrophorhabdaceae bacterium]